jgi:hypothetical protein
MGADKMVEKTKAVHPATKAEQAQYRQYLEGKKNGKSRAVLSKTAGLRLLAALDVANASAVNAAHERDAILGTLFRYGVCLKSFRGKELRACPEGTWLYPDAAMSTVEAGMRQEFCSDCAQQKVYLLNNAEHWQRAYEEFVKDKTNIFANKAITLVSRDARRDRRFLDRRNQLVAMNITEEMRAEKRRDFDRRQYDRRRACP